jgi:histidinol-phosphatase (PHP family)
LIKSLDLLVEINSRGLKKELKSCYPCREVLQLMVEKNVRFTLSDDSHGPNDVGFRYDELKAYCKEMSITTIYDPLDRAYSFDSDMNMKLINAII